MKKYTLLLWVFGILFFSCENLNTDLPSTNIEKYHISGGFLFPKDTTTVDIYNCLLSEDFLNNSERNLSTGSRYSITQNTVLNGTTVSNTHTRNIVKIKITYTEKSPEIHEYIMTLYFDDGKIDFYSDIPSNDRPKDQNGNFTNVLNCVFKYIWQRQTTNVWQNDKILGELVIKW
jgi:hypothetical protein